MSKQYQPSKKRKFGNPATGSFTTPAAGYAQAPRQYDGPLIATPNSSLPLSQEQNSNTSLPVEQPLNLPMPAWSNASQEIHVNPDDSLATTALGVAGPVFNTPFDVSSTPSGTRHDDGVYSGQPAGSAGYVFSSPDFDNPRRPEAGPARSPASIQGGEDEDQYDEKVEEGQEDVGSKRESKHQLEDQGSIANASKAKKPNPVKLGVTRLINDGLQWQDPSTQSWKDAVRHHDIRRQLQQEARNPYPGLSYDYPDDNGGDSFNETSFFLRHQQWGPERENRPAILSMWNKDPSLLPHRRPAPDVMKFYDHVVLDHRDNPIKDHWNVPATLSPFIDGSKLEAMSRENPDLAHVDFLARMPRAYDETNQATGQIIRKSLSCTNTLINMPMLRFRASHPCKTWITRQGSELLEAGILRDFADNGFDPVASGNSTAGFGRDFYTWERKEAKKGNRGNNVSRAGKHARLDEERQARLAREDADIAAKKAAHMRIQQESQGSKQGLSRKRSHKQGDDNLGEPSNVPAVLMNPGHSAFQAHDSRGPFHISNTGHYQPQMPISNVPGWNAPAYGPPAQNDQGFGPSPGSLSEEENGRSSKRHAANNMRYSGYQPMFTTFPQQYDPPLHVGPQAFQQPTHGYPKKLDTSDDVLGHEKPLHENHTGSDVNFVQQLNAQKRAAKVVDGRRAQRQPGASPLKPRSSATIPLDSSQTQAQAPFTVGSDSQDNQVEHSTHPPPSTGAMTDRGSVKASSHGATSPDTNSSGGAQQSLALITPEESSPTQSPPAKFVSAAETQPEPHACNEVHQAPTQQVSPPESPPSADTIQQRPETDIGAPIEVEADTGGAYNSFDADFTAICDELFEEMESGIPNDIFKSSKLQEVDSSGLQDTSNGDLGPGAQAAGQPAGFVVGEIDNEEEETPEKAVESMISPEEVTSSSKRTLEQTATPSEEETQETPSRPAKRQQITQHHVEVSNPQAQGRKHKAPSRANMNPAIQSAARRNKSHLPGQTSQQVAADASQQTKPITITEPSLGNVGSDPPNLAGAISTQSNGAPLPQPTDYRMICPTNNGEIQSLQAALQPTREAFFEWTGAPSPTTNPYSSYCSQWHEINLALQHWWAAQLPGAEAPDLICREAWFTSICEWPPFDKNQPEYFRAWKEGHRVPRTADGTPIDIRGRVLERCGRLEVRKRLMVLNAVLDQMGYAPHGVFFKKIDDDQHDL